MISLAMKEGEEVKGSSRHFARNNFFFSSPLSLLARLGVANFTFHFHFYFTISMMANLL
jgi:hypothetical protein